MTTRYSHDHDAIVDLVNEALQQDDLQQLVLSAARTAGGLRKVEIRQVVLRGRTMLSVQQYDAEKCLTTNVTSGQEPEVQALLPGFRQLMVQTSNTRTDARVTKRGKTLVSVVDEGRQADPRHDRQKHTLLAPDAPFLEQLGVAKNGTIVPSQQRKWRQVNEFLRLLRSLPTFAQVCESAPVRVVDLGSGNAYLSFATYHYLTQVLGVECEMIGVDRDLSVVDRASVRSQALDWPGLRFVESTIATVDLPWRPQVVLSLHACDTATDEAAARALGWESELVLLAPCCHHDVQRQLRGRRRTEWNAALQHGLLVERLGDVLTDSLRTSLIASRGYRTDVVQFVSPEHTAKNLMIRAWRDPSVEKARHLADYSALRDDWQVKPRLEVLLEGEAE